MNIEFSDEYKTVLEKSRQEAIRHYNTEIKPEHLLLALTERVEGKPFQLLVVTTDGSSIYKLRQELDNSIFEQNISDFNADNVIANSLTERIIKLSALEARMLKSDIVEVEHLLLALFHNNEVKNMDFMKEFINIGINYDHLYSQLKTASQSPLFGAGFTDDEEFDEEMTHDGDSDSTSSQKTQSSPKASNKKGNDTPMLDKFGIDMTRAAEECRLDPVIGREMEIERIAQILSRRKKNNPVLIGEPGVG